MAQKKSRKFRWCGPAAALLASVVPAKCEQAKAIPTTDGQFVGATGCKSSSCHGGAGPKRDQYFTWSRDDFHSKAYAVLTNARSARIAETLGSTAAPSDARCTVCHSPFKAVAPARLMQAARLDDGVSCESCHGAAESWLRSHTRHDWTYAMRVGAGMHDLRSLYVRANNCVACHQNVPQDLLKAGHPELTFELDEQAVSEPKHWKDTGEWSGPQAWLTGQAVALREMSWALAESSTPEPDAVARWSGLSWLLQKVCTTEKSLPALASAQEGNGQNFRATQTSADQLARRASQMNWSAERVRALLLALAASDGDFASGTAPENVLVRRAERLVPALDRLSVALQANGSKVKIDPELNLLFQDVNNRATFQSAAFAGHLESLKTALAATFR